MTEMEDDMTSKDMIMMPFIFALMMYIVGSWKFIAIVGPVLGMVMVLSLSSFLPFGKYNVWQINPMALSVDYSMFLISRFASGILNGKLNKIINNCNNAFNNKCEYYTVKLQ